MTTEEQESDTYYRNLLSRVDQAISDSHTSFQRKQDWKTKVISFLEKVFQFVFHCIVLSWSILIEALKTAFLFFQAKWNEYNGHPDINNNAYQGVANSGVNV